MFFYKIFRFILELHRKDHINYLFISYKINMPLKEKMAVEW